MKHFSGYGAYQLFLALRTHFHNAKYDFFKFQGKLRSNKETYLKRNDKYFFEKVAKDYNVTELRDFFIANFLKDKIYITELLDEDAHRNFMEYQRRRQSLSYLFADELDRVFGNSITDPFRLVSGQYPNIVNMYLGGTISPETITIIGDFIPFSPKFDKYLGETDPIWSKISLKLTKYRPFLKYDREKFKHILKEKVDDIRGTSIRNST